MNTEIPADIQQMIDNANQILQLINEEKMRRRASIEFDTISSDIRGSRNSATGVFTKPKSVLVPHLRVGEQA